MIVAVDMHAQPLALGMNVNAYEPEKTDAVPSTERERPLEGAVVEDAGDPQRVPGLAQLRAPDGRERDVVFQNAESREIDRPVRARDAAEVHVAMTVERDRNRHPALVRKDSADLGGG